MATAFPGTSNVESDFSIVKWEKDVMRMSLSDFSLAASFIESHSATTLAIPAIRFTTHFETF